MAEQTLRCGDVWSMRLDPSSNGDSKIIFVLIVSSDSYNAISTGMAIAVPVFSHRTLKGPTQVAISGAGLELEGEPAADCEKLMSIRTSRLVKCYGMVCHESRQNTLRALSYLLGLKDAKTTSGWGA